MAPIPQSTNYAPSRYQSVPGQYNAYGIYNRPVATPTILGANTARTPAPANTPVPTPQPPVNNNNGIDQAAEEARRREEETRNTINSGYGAYEAGLKGYKGMLETEQTDETSSASRIYDQIFGGLKDQKTTNLQKLDAGREAVSTRKVQSIKDLQQNLSNTLRGASMQFGAMGAGDTSATRTMLPYAYTKMAGAQEGKIVTQSNDQLFEIDQQEQDTELEFSKMWRQTEVDKETSISDIKRYYGERISNVMTAMASAPLDKSRDLAALSQALLQEAKANLRNLESEDRQRKENAKNWATTRMSELNNLKLSLSGSANFSPKDIVWDELSMGGNTPQMGGQDSFYNPLLAQKRRDEYLRS
jgi:hypothetical protein